MEEGEQLLLKHILRLESEICKLHYMMGDLKGRLEILEKARNQGMASSAAPASEAASGRRTPWAVPDSGTGVASRVKLAENDVCGSARGAPLFDSAGGRRITLRKGKKTESLKKPDFVPMPHQ